MTDSVEQIESMKKVDSDVENWWRSCLHLTPSHVTEMKKLSGYECFNSRSVPKDTIARLLFQGIQLVEAQRNLIKDMQGRAHVLKSEAISCQSTVIKLEEELISVKDDQIADFTHQSKHQLKPPLSSLLAKLCRQCSPNVVHLMLDLHQL